MQIDIKQLMSGDETILDRVAAEVFDEPIDAARLAVYLADPRHHMFVAVANGEVVGQVAAIMYRHPDKPAELFIDEVGVAPAWRRKGIARRLLDEMLALGKALGCEEAWVGTEMDNLPARALYESYGVPGGRFVMYTFDL